MRLPGSLVGAVVVACALAPASAAAAPTIVRPGPANIFVNGTESDSDLSITYRMVSDMNGPYWSHFVTDEAGVLAKPGSDYSCIQEGSNTAECPDTTSFELFDPSEGGQGESFTILLRGGADDLFINSAGDFEAFGGAGNDTLVGNSRLTPGVGHLGDDLSGGNGNDLVSGGEGPDFLSGGGGRDRLTGGKGNDNLNAKDGVRDKRINCGPGKRDQLLMDNRDPKPTGCEVVVRR